MRLADNERASYPTHLGGGGYPLGLKLKAAHTSQTNDE